MVIIDFDIITSVYSSKVIKEVNKKIKDGWQPYGVLSSNKTSKNSGYGNNRTEIEYSQVMVIYRDSIQIKEMRDDFEKIRHITYATFGEGFVYENANPLEKKIADIDKIIYPKYYDSGKEEKS